MVVQLNPSGELLEWQAEHVVMYRTGDSGWKIGVLVGQLINSKLKVVMATLYDFFDINSSAYSELRVWNGGLLWCDSAYIGCTC